jgi:outer membrane protein assembly factor BamB
LHRTPIRLSNGMRVRIFAGKSGKGHSTPIVWGGRVFITAAVPYGETLQPKYSDASGAHDILPVTQQHRFTVIAVNRRDGKVLWERSVHEGLPFEGVHYTASLASSSPVTDGEHLFAFFGSYGLYCLDLDGKLVWQVDLGDMQTLHSHGEGSSPALYRETLIINWDHEGKSFLIAFDKRSGKELWKVGRAKGTSWTTPIIVEYGSRPQVIVSGSEYVRGYDLATGDVIWECGGLSVENVVSSPVAGDGLVFTGSTYDRQAMLAIRLEGAKGDITGTKQVVWRRNRGAPYVPSPLLYDDALYFLYHFQGILTRVNARTGEDQPGPLRLTGLRSVFASPVAAASRVYITDREGTTLVMSHSDKPEILALNRLDDSFSASAALFGNELFLRGEQNLYCIAVE